MASLSGSVGYAGVVWRFGCAAITRRLVSTSAPLQRRFPRAKLPPNRDLLPRSEQMAVSVTDKPDHSRGVPRPDGGIQYYGFAYYPRFPDMPDPPVTPAKLHRIQLIAPLQGQPYWIKDTCRQLGLHEGRSTRAVGAVNVVKNIPEVNARLYSVKHVIRVDPITFPDGQPANDDLDGWQLLEDGRVVRNAAMRVTPVVTEYDRLKLAPATVRARLRLRWIKPFSLDEKRTV